MKQKNTLTVAVLVLAATSVTPVAACDFCPVAGAGEVAGAGRGFYAGASEQFTHFGTLQVNGRQVDNEAGQWLNSSIAQLFAGYNFTERFGVQFNLPVIHREFKRPEGFNLDRGRESGVGDVSVTGNLVLFERNDETFAIRLSMLGGVKLPTGSSARLAEEAAETEVPGAPESGIHGHDLALGSGSVDGIIGSSALLRWKRLLVTASVQYNARTKGDHEYQFANHLAWTVAPGGYLILNANHSLALQLGVSGEDKGQDTFQGAPASDTARTSVYLGPQLTYTWSDQLSAQLGVDVPVWLDNSALQVVPDYRVRAAVNWRF